MRTLFSTACVVASLSAVQAFAQVVPVTCEGAQYDIENGTTIPLVPTVHPSPSGDTVAARQCGFDAYSWTLFMALNHDAAGLQAVSHGPPTTWESWPESGAIFLPDGARPNDGRIIGAQAQLPQACAGLGDGTLPLVRQVGKHPEVLSESTEPFQSGPLIDANGNYARFTIHANWQMYAYILQHELYSTEGQDAFHAAGHSVNFPCSCTSDPQSHLPAACDADVLGSIMVKAAWKVLDPAADDAARFYSRNALVYTEQTESSPESCEVQEVGLVGLHIAQKNQNDPQWLWSTFEHVRNAPQTGDTPSGAYNFYQTDCDDCAAVNMPPPRPWDPAIQVSQNSGKSQVLRVTPITDNAKQMSDSVQQNLLSGTVWANYELVSTQWPSQGSSRDSDDFQNNCLPVNPVDPSGAPVPAFLANTTLETYIQGTTPQGSSSCINCHLNAADTQGRFSDFTYLLERASSNAQTDDGGTD